MITFMYIGWYMDMFSGEAFDLPDDGINDYLLLIYFIYICVMYMLSWMIYIWV